MPSQVRQVDEDQDHLKILALGYFVDAGLALFSALLGFVYVALGILYGGVEAPTSPYGQMVAGFFGGKFYTSQVAIGSLVLVVFGVTTIMAGRYLAARRHWMFCMVLAFVNLFHLPAGTLIGVFTFAVLLDPAVKARFT
jgi:hypothetical protein